METLKKINTALSILSTIALALWLCFAVYMDDLKWQYAAMGVGVGFYAASYFWIRMHERYREAAQCVMRLQREQLDEVESLREEQF